MTFSKSVHTLICGRTCVFQYLMTNRISINTDAIMRLFHFDLFLFFKGTGITSSYNACEGIMTSVCNAEEKAKHG